MSEKKIAINGFGRIGRAFFRLAKERDEVQIVAINDLADIENLAYLLKYDSAYGRASFDVEADTENSMLVVDGESIPLYSKKDPAELPWNDHEVDVALESTGVFTSYEASRAHLEAGAKKVVVSAPVKDTPPEDIKGDTILMGINDEQIPECDITSNASCTTNAAGPLVQILKEKVGIEKALLNTIHGYTSSQDIVDSPNSKTRRGRAGAQNIVPSSTGAAKATTKVVESLSGKFDGIAVRVPVIVGSIVDITFLASSEVTPEQINDAFREAAKEEKWQKIFTVTEDPIVSTDIIGQPYGSIADLAMTRVAGGNLAKVMGWYDNEMGYTSVLLEHMLQT